MLSEENLAAMAAKGISISRQLSSFDETSPCFLIPEKIAQSSSSQASRTFLKGEAVELYTALDEICDRIMGSRMLTCWLRGEAIWLVNFRCCVQTTRSKTWMMNA